MKILNKMYRWLFTKLFEDSLSLKTADIYTAGNINMGRCEKAYNFINDSIKEMNSDLEDKVHLYIIDIWESSEDVFLCVIDGKDNHVYKYYNDFCSICY